MSFDFQLENMNLPKSREMLSMMISHVSDMLSEGVTCIDQQCYLCPFSIKYRGSYKHEDFIKADSPKCLFSSTSRKKATIEKNLQLFLSKLSKVNGKAFEDVEEDKRRKGKRINTAL